MSTFTIFLASLALASTLGFGTVPTSLIWETKPPTIEKKGYDISPPISPPAPPVSDVGKN
jgi:hypothetical protein